MGAAPTWRSQAACLGMDTAIWFPEDGQRNDQAKAICDGCPVEAECLAGAVERHEGAGIFGGLTETERRPLIRARFGAMPQRARRPRPRKGPPNRHDSTGPGPQAMELPQAMEVPPAAHRSVTADHKSVTRDRRAS
jgi:hypothetical protein